MVLNILPISLSKLPILKVCAKHVLKVEYHRIFEESLHIEYLTAFPSASRPLALTALCYYY